MSQLLMKHYDKKEEGGFTLIELLVVIIIIGILAAIAIPVFLSQRERGWRSAVESDLRNAAVAQESYFTEHSEYSDTIDGLEPEGFRPSDAVDMTDADVIVRAGPDHAYCMQAYHTAAPGFGTTADPERTDYHFLSQRGSPERGECPAMTDWDD